jgi:suppressor of ftsI
LTFQYTFFKEILVLRRFLVFSIAFGWLAGCGGSSSTPTSPILPGERAGAPLSQPNSAKELPEPPVIKSVHGVAKLSLIVNLSGHTGFPQFVYNGFNETAPTIQVNPGDTIKINVNDSLPPAKADQADINLHFHGLGTSPHAPGDDVLGMLARPGQTLHYVVHVAKNQEPGLYWYHPHVHGQTNYHVGAGGMSGAIIVNGLERHFPRLAKMRQRMIIVRDTGNGEKAQRFDTMADMPGMSGMSGMSDAQSDRPQVINNEPCGPETGLVTSLNYVNQPDITIAAGEKQFFRVINAAGHKTLKLAVDGEKLTVVAIDGFALDSYPGTPPTLVESYAVVPPAGRVEFVVTGPRSRSAKFRTLCYDTGSGGDRDPELVLANLVPPSRSQNEQARVSAPLAVGEPLPRNVYTSPLPPVSAKRVVVFSEGNKRFLINGRVFSMQDPPLFVVHAGTMEQWRIVNVSPETHDFHIHQLHFLVKEIDGVKVTHPFWADSQIIPHRRASGKAGTLVLLMDFRDPVIKGTFLFHCHILDHEDRGMMAKIQAI